MNHKPIKYTEWLESRREFMARIGWLSRVDVNAIFLAEEYRAMLIALKKECTVQGIASTLGSSWATIRNDRKLLGITAERRGGAQRKNRLFSYNNKLMTCQEIADLNGCCYDTAYGRLTRGGWKNV